MRPRNKQRSNALKISCIGTRGVPSNYSGIERACESIYSILAARGHQITVYCRPDCLSSGNGLYRGIRRKYAPSLRGRSLETVSHAAASLLSAILNRDCDVIHMHALAPGLVSSLCRLRSIPLVATIHGLDWQRAKWAGAGSKVLLFAEKQLVENARELIVVSRDLQEYFSRRYGRATHYIPNGVPLAPPDGGDPALLSKLGLPASRYVLFVGRLVPEKRIEDLIVAFRDVPGTYKLALAGESSYTTGYVRYLRELAAPDSRVVFTGLLDEPSVHRLYANAAAYVQPSELEGLPMSLLECVSHSTPAIVSDIPPHREVLGTVPGYDLFFRPLDTADLAGKITQVLADPMKFRSVAAAASHVVRKEYSWEAIAGDTERVLQSACRAARPQKNGVTPEGVCQMPKPSITREMQ